MPQWLPLGRFTRRVASWNRVDTQWIRTGLNGREGFYFIVWLLLQLQS
jgi:hypothetical protein